MRITKELAQKFLSDVPEPTNFWINNGPILKNLHDLVSALKEMSDETFAYHVNKEKNDFSNWTKDIVGDERLANEILKSRNKHLLYKKVKHRVDLLKKIAKH